MELSGRTGQFYRGSLNRGDVIESEASIVVIGDVHHGARVTAKGNIIVLGLLGGTVHAGAAGNRDAVVAAFGMSPLQLTIASCTLGGGDKGKRLGRGAMIASVSENGIRVETIKKSFFNYFNFI